MFKAVKEMFRRRPVVYSDTSVDSLTGGIFIVAQYCDLAESVCPINIRDHCTKRVEAKTASPNTLKRLLIEWCDLEKRIGRRIHGNKPLTPEERVKLGISSIVR